MSLLFVLIFSFISSNDFELYKKTFLDNCIKGDNESCKKAGSLIEAKEKNTNISYI